MRRARRLLAEPATPPWEILEIPQNASRPDVSEAFRNLLINKWYPFEPTTDDERALKLAFIKRIISAASAMNPQETVAVHDMA